MEPLKEVDSGILQDKYKYVVSTKDVYDDEYKHFEDNTYAVAARQVKQVNTCTLGMVIYADAGKYKDKSFEELHNIHIPFVISAEGRSVMAELFSAYFLRVYGHELKQVTFGHEHGTKDNKCHIQMCIEFKKNFRGTVRPSVVNFDCPISFSNEEGDGFHSAGGTRILFMSQIARNPRALQQYCKKDGDFWFLYPDLAIRFVYDYKLDKDGNIKKDSDGKEIKKVMLWPSLAANRGLLSIDDAKDLVRTHDPRSFYLMGKNLDYQLERDMCGTVPSLVWSYPEHLRGKYALIENWFNNWCVPADLKRRKALLLYSPERCMGKTEFALSLVNDLSYVVCFRNTFVQDNIKGKVPKLLVLDDMSSPDVKNKETWKALVAGQKTSIRDCHFNFAWEHEVPCIITTNNEFLVKLMVTSPEFNTQVVIQYVYDYMGPPGTKPTGLDQIEYDLPEFLLDKFKKEKFEYEKKKEEEKMLGKKSNRYNNNI